MGIYCGDTEPGLVTRKILDIEKRQAWFLNNGVPSDPGLEVQRQALLNPDELTSLSKRVITVIQYLFRVASTKTSIKF